MQIRKNNSGFTLIEMIITTAILGILLSAVAVTFPQWLNQYLFIQNESRAVEIMDIVAAGVGEELRFSKDRTIDDVNGLTYACGKRICTIPLNQEECTITYEDDELIITGQPKIYGSIFDTGIYNDLYVTLTMKEETVAPGNVLMRTKIEIFSEGGQPLCSETKTTHYYNP